MNNKNLRSIVVAAFVLLTLQACTSLENVPINRSNPQDLRSQLSVGETVLVRLHGGEERQLRIVALAPDAIVGRGQRIAYADIDVIDVKYVDFKGTAQATGAIALLAVVFVGGAMLDAESGENFASEAPCRTNGSGGMICNPK